MAIGENKYNVKLEFVAYDTKDPKTPINLNLTEWNDLPYVGLVGVQRLLIKLMEGTNEWGQAVVQQKGLDKLPGT